MKLEEVKACYDALPARIKDENAKITNVVKGLTALNKTHASMLNRDRDHFLDNVKETQGLATLIQGIDGAKEWS